MKNKNKLKEIDAKNRACYYFDDTINCIEINFSNILKNKKLYEHFQFITFRIKLVQNYCVLD